MAKTRDRIRGGCTEYITADVTVTVSFPTDLVICDICDFCRAENNGTRFRCLLNSKILPWHNKSIGLYCPLPIEQKVDYDEEDLG